MNEETNKSGFTIKDKRRFDEGGNERSSESSTSNSDANVGQSESNVNFSIPDSDDSSKVEAAKPGEEIDFSSFIMSLATQALMQLGQLQAPAGVEIPVDKNAARQTIEIISMLQEKTKGNLSKEESMLVGELLHNLRMGFVRS